MKPELMIEEMFNLYFHKDIVGEVTTPSSLVKTVGVKLSDTQYRELTYTVIPTVTGLKIIGISNALKFNIVGLTDTVGLNRQKALLNIVHEMLLNPYFKCNKVSTAPSTEIPLIQRNKKYRYIVECPLGTSDIRIHLSNSRGKFSAVTREFLKNKPKPRELLEA